jgi:RNA polymerase sigma-70 factor (ECF subfamily)
VLAIFAARVPSGVDLLSPRTGLAKDDRRRRTLMTNALSEEVIPHISRLRSFARRLAGNHAAADDLVQVTLLNALTHADQFRPGTNLLAWLMTILRNTHFNEKRRLGRIVSIDPASDFQFPSTAPDQGARLHFDDVARRFAELSPAQREALILVGAEGLSYEHAAAVSGCAVGTMKSRVSRARDALRQRLDEGDAPVWSAQGEALGHA